jgi:hypothetical protein
LSLRVKAASSLAFCKGRTESTFAGFRCLRSSP